MRRGRRGEIPGDEDTWAALDTWWAHLNVNDGCTAPEDTHCSNVTSCFASAAGESGRRSGERK